MENSSRPAAGESQQQNGLEPFVKEYEIRYKEVNDRQEATPVALMSFVEEAASDDCARIDRSVFDLQKKGLGWVLYSGCFKMDRYPLYREKIKIVTWISKFRGFTGYREYQVYSLDNRFYGGFRSLWLYFDLERRKPVAVDPVFYERWAMRPQKAIEREIVPSKKPLGQTDSERSFAVQRYDIDSNDHVNNVRYMQWLMEAIPDEFYRRARMEFIQGTFLSETFYNRHVKSECLIVSPSELLHAVTEKESGKLLATAGTSWSWEQP